MGLMRPVERWQLLLDGECLAAENMARDEALLLSLEEGWGRPTLRLYGWQEKALSVGYMQDATGFVDCGLTVVRRPTGGRAVLHWRELTYSMVAPMGAEPFNRGLRHTYYVINNIIKETLREVGIEAELSCRKNPAEYRKRESCFHSASRYEITVRGRKLSGGAQRRLKRAFLQHGSILLSVEKGLVERLFGEDAHLEMAAVGEFVSIDKDVLKRLLVEKMAQGLSVEFEEAEKKGLYTERVLLEKYSNPLWNIKGRTSMGV